MKLTMVLAGAFLLGAIAFGAGATFERDGREKALDETIRVCYAGDSRECNMLQLETGTEFICGQYKCWLEIK